MKPEKKWSPLHHMVWRKLRDAKLHLDRNRPFLIGVSGGADSMALLNVVKDLPLKFEVFHAHHGPGENQDDRVRARDFVRSFCLQHKISMVEAQSQQVLKSESEMRNFRRQHILDWLQAHPGGIVMTAHHAQDLLETRVMRLIRGTGPEGLAAMRAWKAPFFRPFLDVTPFDLRQFLTSRKLEWVEDPSNMKTRYFRNWIRQKWLPALERRQAGALARLSQSLENLIHDSDSLNLESGLLRSQYLALSDRKQLEVLAQLLRRAGLQEFTLGQLKEVQKRLDNPQGRLIFNVAGALWSVNAERIVVSKKKNNS